MGGEQEEEEDAGDEKKEGVAQDDATTVKSRASLRRRPAKRLSRKSHPDAGAIGEARDAPRATAARVARAAARPTSLYPRAVGGANGRREEPASAQADALREARAQQD